MILFFKRLMCEPWMEEMSKAMIIKINWMELIPSNWVSIPLSHNIICHAWCYSCIDAVMGSGIRKLFTARELAFIITPVWLTTMFSCTYEPATWQSRITNREHVNLNMQSELLRKLYSSRISTNYTLDLNFFHCYHNHFLLTAISFWTISLSTRQVKITIKSTIGIDTIGNSTSLHVIQMTML